MKVHLNFAERLAARLHDMPPPRKADRTRERLKVAAVRTLEKKGYIQLRVIDITDEAEMSEGVFYTYFRDKKDICGDVLSEFMHFIPTQRHFQMGAGDSAFDAIRRANMAWFACARANSGLIRCLFQFQDNENGFANLVQRVTREWYDLTTRKITSHYSEGAVHDDAILIALYALGGMIDEVTRLMWVNPNTDLGQVLARNDMSDADLAEFLAVIWHRAVYPSIAISDVKGPIAQSLVKIGCAADHSPIMPLVSRDKSAGG